MASESADVAMCTCMVNCCIGKQKGHSTFLSLKGYRRHSPTQKQLVLFMTFDPRVASHEESPMNPCIFEPLGSVLLTR